MKKSVCRYSDAQLRSLGYEPCHDEYRLLPSNVSSPDINTIARGQIGNIIDVLFTCKEGSLDNNLQSIVSENAPESVRSFVNNVLLCDLKALQSAPDDETAFRCLIPRTAYTPSELKPYLEDIKSFVSQSRQSISKTS